MRFRVGLVLCLFTAYVTAGCRTALTPNIDRNQPPETFITAAPFDTITLSKSDPTQNPGVATIPVRFHMYWAGSDQDGAVAGFYWAVTETLPGRDEFGNIPPLPGPKPSDYHYTTRTDSTFVFKVAENVPDRTHAFFIYAVDNLGKVDPTPARFIFSAQDKYKPIPIFLVSKGVGTIWERDANGGLIPVQREYPITDPQVRGSFPRDTVPANATLIFAWTSQNSAAGTSVTGYKYKLDEPTFIDAAPGQNEVRYHTGVGADTTAVASGTKIFTLRVLDQAGGSNDSTRRFVANFSPDTWWSGPDPNSPAWHVKPNGEKWINVSEVKPGGALNLSGIPGSLFGTDSVLVMPANRPERKTFIEVWKDTLYLRAEFDTIHMNSWTMMHSGGFDKDSQYRVLVSDEAKGLPPCDPGAIGCTGIPVAPRPVLEQQGVTGSPVGFRMRASYAETPDEADLFFGQSGVYPLFDPNDVNNLQRIANYFPHYIAGRAYMLAMAEDGDGARDTRITSVRGLVDETDGPPGTGYPCTTCGTDSMRALRSKIMVVYVDKTPYFVTTPATPPFAPLPGQTFTSSTWSLNLPAADPDPYDGSSIHGGPGGSTPTILRRRLWVHGKNAQGAPLTVPFEEPHFETAFPIVMPPELAAGPCDVEIELCDCTTCEETRGQGRCIRWTVPVIYAPSSPQYGMTGNR